MADDKNAAEGQRGPTAPAAGPARALDHVGISVPDIDAAVAWYRDVLGCYVLMEPIEGYATTAISARSSPTSSAPTSRA